MNPNDVCCCYKPDCEACAEIATNVYCVQNHYKDRCGYCLCCTRCGMRNGCSCGCHIEGLIIYCHGCGNDQNHPYATSCATCLARYIRMMAYYIKADVTLFSEDTKLMIYGKLGYHCTDTYSHLPNLLRPLCVDKPGYAYVQFTSMQIVNVHTYNRATATGIERAAQITIKL
jgi:hypothetical protein